MGKLVLVIFAEHHYQVSPLPVESSLPPINWDNIKAKWGFAASYYLLM